MIAFTTYMTRYCCVILPLDCLCNATIRYLPDREHTVRNQLAQNEYVCRWSERYCQYTCSHTVLVASPWPIGIDDKYSGIFNGPSKEGWMSNPMPVRLLHSYTRDTAQPGSTKLPKQYTLSIIFIENVKKIGYRHVFFSGQSVWACTVTASYSSSSILA